MMFQVFDCLADTELSRMSSRNEADEIKAIHGGADNCIHVFEVSEPVENVAEIKEKKPSKGELFG